MISGLALFLFVHVQLDPQCPNLIGRLIEHHETLKQEAERRPALSLQDFEMIRRNELLPEATPSDTLADLYEARSRFLRIWVSEEISKRTREHHADAMAKALQSPELATLTSQALEKTLVNLILHTPAREFSYEEVSKIAKVKALEDQRRKLLAKKGWQRPWKEIRAIEDQQKALLRELPVLGFSEEDFAKF